VPQDQRSPKIASNDFKLEKTADFVRKSLQQIEIELQRRDMAQLEKQN
jgi:hypothetical protein